MQTNPDLLTSLFSHPQAIESQGEDKLKAGLYGAVRSLLRALDKGPEAKHVLDSVIDACSAMQVWTKTGARSVVRGVDQDRGRMCGD